MRKLLNDRLTIALSTVLVYSFSVRAEISNQTRASHAYLLYEFNGAGSNYTDSSTKGTALNLSALYPDSGVAQANDAVEISARNMISSAQPAKKLIDACKASNEMSFEVWLENNETAQERSGFFPKEDTRQPLRILTLSNALNNQNFSLGQFYEDGNTYVISVSTSGRDMTGTTVNSSTIGSMNSALQTKVSAVIVPNTMVTQGQVSDQKIIFTLNKDGVANLYLSDRNGQMYLAQTDSTKFTAADGRGLLASWKDNMYLTLGNVYTTNTEIAKDIGTYNRCADDASIARTANNCGVGSRYWKGKINRVAVYCKALSKLEVLGESSLTEIEVKPQEVDLAVQVSPNLQRAQQIHQRLTGSKIPLTSPVIKNMEMLLNAGDGVGAAGLAIEDAYFYNVVLRDFASKMSNRDETINVPLNDFTATVIGAVRDNIDARQLLTENFFYMADPTKASVPSDMVSDLLRSNNHYESLTAGRYDLSKVLVSKKQYLFDGQKAVENPTPAGLLTTRQWLAAHAIAGTNRRPVEFALREFTCTSMEKAADASGPDNVVGRDIDRFPGGSHSKYTTSCRACHTVMDGFRPAFGHVTFNSDYVMHSFITPKVRTQTEEDNGAGMLVSTDAGASQIHYKINKNETVFPGGNVVKDDSWVNNANYGANKTFFGWKATQGKGIKAFGQLIANSDAFPRCLAQKVFRSVCKRDPIDTESTFISGVANEFKTKAYDIKFLFKKIVSSEQCLGGQ